MIDDIFETHSLLGILPELTPWYEVELYRKFNNGHLPTDPLHTPWRGTNRKGLRLSTIAARALWRRG